jgi:hypothetical protein
MAAFVVADSLLQPSKTIGMRVAIEIIIFIVYVPNLYASTYDRCFRRLAIAAPDILFVSIITVALHIPTFSQRSINTSLVAGSEDIRDKIGSNRAYK